MDGVEATRRIMTATPCAILVVTASIGANVSKVFDAMGHGALDAVDTPEFGSGNLRDGAAPLLAKIDVIGKLIGDNSHSRGAETRSAKHTARFQQGRLVAMGASAGGPMALATVLGSLPKDFSAAIVIVQHVDEHFAPGMAEWLGRYSSLPVRLAREDETPAAGAVLLAATNDHLTLKSADRLGYSPEPRDYVYRPSVDVFFESICRHWKGDAVGVLLTGMGRDGAKGLKAMRKKGYYTLTQNEASCAVYGMPKAARLMDAAVDILPLENIAAKLTEVLSVNGT